MDADAQQQSQKKGSFVKIIAKYLFSHVGLCLLVIAYVVGGAYLFRHLEAAGEEERIDAQVQRSNEIETERDELAQLLWNYKNGPDYNTTVALLIEQYHENVTEAIRDYSYTGVPIQRSDLKAKWGVASAILFTVTIVTTIGYGHVTPVTALGQLTVIGYALLGVPLMLMFLANIGDAMARFLRIAYGKGCCYCCHKKRQKEYVKAMEEMRVNKAETDQVSSIPSNRPRSAWSDEVGTDIRHRKVDAEKGKDATADALPSPVLMEDPMLVMDAADAVINVPISLTLVIIAAYIFLGAVLFAAWNGWSWITGAYFSFVTLSTIGFGDLIPGLDQIGTTAGTIKLIVSAFYIVLGLAVLSMSFNLMMEEMIAKFEWLGRKLGIIDDPANMMEPTDVQPFVAQEELPNVEPVRI